VCLAKHHQMSTTAKTMNLKAISPLKISIFLSVLCSIWSCSSVKVVSFENPRANFGQFEEYALKQPVAENSQLTPEGKIFIEKFETAVKTEMANRGYQLTYSPDIEVSYDIVSSRQRDTNVNRSPFYYNPWYYGTTYNIYESNYTESIIIIDIKDLGTGKTVWQGSLDLRYTRNSKKKETIIPDAVHNIFGDYPYQAGSSKKLTPDTGKKRDR